MKNLHSKLLFPLLAAALALVGCNSDSSVTPGSGSASGSGSGTGGSGSGSGTGGGTVFNGQVVKGVTANAVITAYAPDGAGGYTLIDSTTSNGQGAYSLTLPAGYTGAVKIVASASMPPAAPTLMRCDANAGCGPFANPSDANDLDGDGQVDFAEWMPVASDFSLRAVAAVTGTGVRLINLTPLSSVASDWAEKFPQGLDASSATTANTQAAVNFGFEAADLEMALGDIADPLWLNLADPKQIKLALLMATFSELAQHVGFNPQTIIDMVSAEFSGNHGRLMELSTTQPRLPTVFQILNTTATLAGVLEMPDHAKHADIVASMNAAVSGLQDGRFALPIETRPYDFLAKLGPLGRDIDELLNVTGLNEPLLFADQQIPYFDWILDEENIKLFPLAFDTTLYALVASATLGVPAIASQAEWPMVNTATFRVVLKPSLKKLYISGVRYDQQVNFVIDLTSLTQGIINKRFVYGIDGTISNATADGRIKGTMAITTGTTDLSLLLNALNSVPMPGAEGEDVGGCLCTPYLKQLIREANGTLALEGEAYLTRKSDPEQVFGGKVALNATLDMGAAEGKTIATLNVTRAELVLPNGSMLYGLPDKPVLTVVVGDDATLMLDGAGMVLGLPEATAHAQGTMINARALFKHLQNTLIQVIDDMDASTQPDAPDFDWQAAITSLFDFDPKAAGMHIRGTGVIDIPGMPSGRDHQYRAELDDLNLKIFQPHSNEVAMSVSLDTEKQVARMNIGGERWNMSVMTTPTPRLMMIGPEGQFVEASQEDFYDFLSMLPLGKLFPSLEEGEGDSSDCVLLCM